MAAPVHIGTLIAEVLTRLQQEGNGVLLEVCRQWVALVGPGIAANTRPIGLRDRLLLVEVSSSVWMQQLQFLKADLIARIQSGLPEARVEKIRFKIASP
jgi:predicted nucleic acid-binding Zn ribbon protein